MTPLGVGVTIFVRGTVAFAARRADVGVVARSAWHRRVTVAVELLRDCVGQLVFFMASATEGAQERGYGWGTGFWGSRGSREKA